MELYLQLIFPVKVWHLVRTVGLMHCVFAILIAGSVQAAPFAPIDQGATAAIAAIVIVVVIVVLVVVVLVVVVIAAGDEE